MIFFPGMINSNKSFQILQEKCARIIKVLADFDGYSTHAGTDAKSLTVVICALILGGRHRKKTATQSQNPLCAY